MTENAKVVERHSQRILPYRPLRILYPGHQNRADVKPQKAVATREKKRDTNIVKVVVIQTSFFGTEYSVGIDVNADVVLWQHLPF